MFRRTMDATFLNEVANRPDVRPFLGGGDGDLDLTAICQNTDNVVLEAPGKGGWLLQPILPGVYELHTIFLPEARGREYFAIAKAAMTYLFTHTDAVEIVTKCPDDNGGARMAASLMGFRERFRREEAWTPGVGISFQVLSMDDWVARSKECLLAGQAFHRALDKARGDAGVEAHPDDAAHDRAAGAAYLMIQAANTGKGVAFYNRFAVFAGYATIAALSQNVVDIRDAVVEVYEGEMRVLTVRRPPG